MRQDGIAEFNCLVASNNPQNPNQLFWRVGLFDNQAILTEYFVGLSDATKQFNSAIPTCFVGFFLSVMTNSYI